MLEATQLKAVRTVVEVIRDDPAVIEVQVVAIAARGGRRPAEPVDADVIQRTVVRVATARLPLSNNERPFDWLPSRGLALVRNERFRERG